MRVLVSAYRCVRGVLVRGRFISIEISALLTGICRNIGSAVIASLFHVLSNCVGDVFFVRLGSVLVDVGLVFVPVSQTTGSVYASAGTRHSLNEVSVCASLGQLEQRHTAFFNAAAHRGLKLKIDVLLLKSLFDRFGKTAGAGKNAAVI